MFRPCLASDGDCNDATIEESDMPMIMKSRKNALYHRLRIHVYCSLLGGGKPSRKVIGS